MKRSKSKKYVLKILERNPLGEESLIVELTEIVDEPKDDSDRKKKLIEKLTEELWEDAKYDEPY